MFDVSLTGFSDTEIEDFRTASLEIVHERCKGIDFGYKGETISFIFIKNKLETQEFIAFLQFVTSVKQ